MDRWKEYFLDTLAQSKRAATQVKKWQGQRTGVYSGTIARESTGYWVCNITDGDRTPSVTWETEPIKNITGLVFTPGDNVLIAFTQAQGYIIGSLD